MEGLYIDLVLCILEWCDPHSLSELSLINKRYSELLNGNKILSILSVRHEVNLESFRDYQLFCEIKCMVPQASKHYDSGFLLINFPELRPPHDKMYYCMADVSTMYNIGKSLYNEDAHTKGHLIPSNINDIYFDRKVGLTYNRQDYLEYLITYCPSMSIVIKYWMKYEGK